LSWWSYKAGRPGTATASAPWLICPCVDLPTVYHYKRRHTRAEAKEPMVRQQGSSALNYGSGTIGLHTEIWSTICSA